MAAPPVSAAVRHVVVQFEVVPAGREYPPVGERACGGEQLAHLSGVDERIAILRNR